MSEMLQSPQDLLQNGKSIICFTEGHSMEPLLIEGKTQVLIEPASEEFHRGDILLWHRWDGKYILHRMVGEDNETVYLLGDHCAKTNAARRDRILGVVTQIFRGRKWLPVTAPRYRLYVRFWMGTMRPRRYLLHLRHRAARMRRRNMSDDGEKDE